jgi:predicted alpha/beta hydrolase family esterase
VKRVILVHRWDGSPDADWYPWLKEELEEQGVGVVIPEMPDPERPEITSWVSFLQKQKFKIDKDTYFIGHSVGCQTILRYLAALPAAHIGGCLFVGGWFTLNLETNEEREIAGPWMTTPLDFDKVKKMGPIVALFSDDDPFVPLENKKTFEQKLGARTIVEHQQGHFNDSTAPAVLRELQKLLKGKR